MSARSPEVILESFVQDQGKEANLRRKLKVNKPVNWFLALTLHSFAKLAQNRPLSDLELTIVTAFRKNGFKDAQLKKQGELYLQLPETVRKEIFPAKFASLTIDNNYTCADLTKAAPGITQSVLNMKNVTKVDVGAIHEGLMSEAEIAVVSKTVLQMHAGAIFVATAANTQPASAPSPTYTIKATRFRCNEETGWDWTGSDEPYWIFGSLGLGEAVTTRSNVFSDVDTGDSRNFDADDGCIWGQNGLPQALPDGEIGVHIELWEHDNGDPTAVKNGVAAAFAAAAGILAATGVAAWVGAIVAGVGAILQWLLGFLDDDHIANQTFVITRQVIVDRMLKVGQSFTMTRRFSDGDGDYTLTVQVSRAS